jgi:hypothetical protein
LLLLLLQLFAQTTDDTLVAIDQSTRQSARRKTDEIQISRGGGSSSNSRAAEVTLKLFVTGQGLFLLLRSHSQQLAIEILVIIFTARN